MSIDWCKKRKKVPPYTKLAPVYDFLMRHVDYVEWAAYIDRLIATFGTSVKRILDVSCGTGNFVFELDKKDYDLLGFDFTFDMVYQARMKALRKGLSIPFWRGNMTHFFVQEPQDAILCLYDSINYLMSIENCRQFYNVCFQNLMPQGILIFDICTEWNSIINFQNLQDRERTRTAKIIRKSYYDQENRIHYNDFKLLFRNDFSIYQELHRQKIFYINEIVTSVPTEKFKILAVLDGLTRREGTENSERVHFVLQKMG